MQKTLNTFVVGEKGKVLALMAQGKMKRKLFDMGVTTGVEIELKKVAPLGDPLQLKLRGYDLLLRKDEAANVVMEC